MFSHKGQLHATVDGAPGFKLLHVVFHVDTVSKHCRVRALVLVLAMEEASALVQMFPNITVTKDIVPHKPLQ